MKHNYTALVIVSLTIGVSTIAHATTFTYNETITLNPGGITTNNGVMSYELQFSGLPTVTVQAGDVITGTINFVGGPIHLVDAAGDYDSSVIFFFSQTSSSGLTTSESATMTFQGLSGTFGNSNPVNFLANGGPLADGLTSNGGGYDFTFTGLTYSITLNSVANGSTQVAAPFAFSQFGMSGQTLAFGAAATREPASFALCGLGFLALGCFAKRTNRSVNKVRTCTIVLGAIAVAACSSASAAQLTLDETLSFTPNQIVQANSREYLNVQYSGLPSVVVEAGDTLSGTITFNTPVTVQNFNGDYNDYISFDFTFADGTNGGMSVTDSGSQYLGLMVAQGTEAPILSPNGGCCASIGTFADGQAHDFSITGINYSLTFTSVTDSANMQIAAPLTFIGMYFGGDSVSLGALSSSTPEPATIFTSAAALGALALARRKRRCATTR